MKKYIMIIMLLLMVSSVSAANIDLSSETTLDFIVRGINGLTTHSEFDTGMDFDKDGYNDTIVLCELGRASCPSTSWCETGLCHLKIRLSCGNEITTTGYGEGMYFQLLQSEGGSPELNMYNGATIFRDQYAIQSNGACGLNEVMGFVSVDATIINGPFNLPANEITLWATDYSTNTAPVINSISPSERTELTVGETQLYTADVTDEDGDASYSWTIGSVEVSTSETFYADWDDIEPGIYTLTLNVSDAEYSDSESVTLEIRAKGGSSSFSTITGSVVEEEEITYIVTNLEQEQSPLNPIQKFMNWLRGLFR